MPTAITQFRAEPRAESTRGAGDESSNRIVQEIMAQLPPDEPQPRRVSFAPALTQSASKAQPSFWMQMAKSIAMLAFVVWVLSWTVVQQTLMSVVPASLQAWTSPLLWSGVMAVLTGGTQYWLLSEQYITV